MTGHMTGATHERFAPAETAAMRRALVLAASPDAPLGPNPRVGCVLLDTSGTVVAEGYHRGAGTPHAEVDALADLAARGGSATGLTAVVTLEPCNHTGRTGPCAEALLAAGVRRVVHAQSDRRSGVHRGSRPVARRRGRRRRRSAARGGARAQPLRGRSRSSTLVPS